MLLPAKTYFIPEKQSCIKDAFEAFGPSGFEIIFALPIEVEVFYMKVSKAQLEISGFERPI